jgi:hypothetical protein
VRAAAAAVGSEAATRELDVTSGGCCEELGKHLPAEAPASRPRIDGAQPKLEAVRREIFVKPESARRRPRVGEKDPAAHPRRDATVGPRINLRQRAVLERVADLGEEIVGFGTREGELGIPASFRGPGTDQRLDAFEMLRTRDFEHSCLPREALVAGRPG